MPTFATDPSQAEAIGLVRQSGPGCIFDRVTLCWVFARSPDPASQRSFSATVVRGQREDVLSDHVVLQYSTTDMSWHYGPVAVGDGLSILPEAPARWPPLTAVGEGLGTAGAVRDHIVVVEEGSRVAGPPYFNFVASDGDIAVILEVTGDPRAVLDAYLHQLRKREGSRNPDVREVGSAVVTRAFAGGGSSDHFTLTLVERAGRPTWLAISASHD